LLLLKKPKNICQHFRSHRSKRALEMNCLDIQYLHQILAIFDRKSLRSEIIIISYLPLFFSLFQWDNLFKLVHHGESTKRNNRKLFHVIYFNKYKKMKKRCEKL